MSNFKELKEAYLMSKDEDNKINREWEYATLESGNFDTDINSSMLDFEREFGKLERDPEYVLEGLKVILAIRLKKLVLKKVINEEEAKKKLGISDKEWEEIFSGDGINLEKIAEICAKIGIEPHELIPI
jgi:DNA-binding Xre family transcriptional regulator